MLVIERVWSILFSRILPAAVAAAANTTAAFCCSAIYLSIFLPSLISIHFATLFAYFPVRRSSAFGA